MKIILHADDFGFNEDTVNATIECFEEKALTSASIMVTCPSAMKAINYAKLHPEYSFGVHLTYVDGLKPVVHPSQIKTLVDENGLFLKSDFVRKNSILFKNSIKELVNETLSQIEVLKQNGVKVSHLDSHGHIHKFPSNLLALNEVVRISDLNKVRGVQNIFLSTYEQHIGIVPMLNNIFRAYIKKHFKTTDYFYMPANRFDTKWCDDILRQIDKLDDDAVLEIGVHPGHEEDWRKHEFDDIKKFASLIKSTKHSLIDWNSI